MNIPVEFDSIRPYAPEELPHIYDELLADPMFCEVVKQIMPGVSMEVLAGQMKKCTTNLAFQKAFFYPMLKEIIKKCTKGLTFDCSSLTDKEANYTFISNHRDIILDPAFLAISMVDNGFDTAEIAIGDNLLIYPWIMKLVRINKSFIVKRGLSLRQQLESSQLMAKYMHFAHNEKHDHIWIAQRQGRAKDSNDRTQDSILKMIAMAGEGDIFNRLKEMNIVPLSLSYEFDPCDYLKAQEAQQKRDNAQFKKTPQDDLINMKTGIYGYKGRVHFHTAPCINQGLDEIKAKGLPKATAFTEISKLIDHQIHSNYCIYPNNYIACDLWKNSDHFATHYTQEEKETFITYVKGQIAKVQLANKDEDFLRERILEMYANPLINHLKAIEE